MIPYGKQSISQADIDAVTEVLRSDWLTQGPAAQRFEAAVAQYVGARHAVAVSNGTGALHLACLAAGLGDVLWTSPISFVASANCARYCGADVDFVDIDPRTYCMSPDALEVKLGLAEREGRLPKVVVPVHMAGQPCDMVRIGALADLYGFTIIEDAAHAIGATHRGRRVGGCDFSAMSVFSFHPVKIVTTGEGGMVTTNDAVLADRLSMLRMHGITRDFTAMEMEPDGPWYYEQLMLGMNYRMTDIQCALGASQMTRIGEFLARRDRITTRYNDELAGLPLTLPYQSPEGASAWHLYVIRVRQEGPRTRAEVFAALRDAGIAANVHYIPVHLQPYYRRLGFGPGDFPVAEAYYEEAISLPVFPALTEDEQSQVIAALREALS